MSRRGVRGDRRLLGTWRSDRKLTLAEWVFPRTSTSKGRKLIRDAFGKFTMRYTPTRIYTDFDGDTSMCRYELLASDEESVAILRFIEEGRTEIQHIHFINGDVHWVSTGRNREFFRRVAA